ncbi:mitochondrial inner membrane protease subunit 2 [Sitodiplosis mosellana]|uniref:mitochondrial inner membrane protease subunit 2 n=1 Tax=Sitodiplosis mosellana TaxID=263140 RepID=UPI0024442E70|nr:mitochondrial inner membrane protease subunit 2 [Sitodiplosis mosellana]
MQYILKTVALSLPVMVTFVDSVGYIARVDGTSMQPALNPNSGSEDYVFLSKWAVRDMYVQRGDIISLTSPKDPSQKLIKRIVGLQGDIVPTIGYKKPYVKVPPGHCWVEGDHTGYSLDSNTFGPVSLGLMTARATCIVWPPSRWGGVANEVPRKRQLVSLGKSKSSID